MALFKITVKQNCFSNGLRLEKGMCVDVSSTYSNPITTNGGHEVIDAFKRIYNLDLKKLFGGSINSIYFDVVKVK